MNVQISKIKPSPLNESVYGKITDGDVADLIESIRDLEGDWPGVLPEHYKDLGIYFADQNLAQEIYLSHQMVVQLSFSTQAIVKLLHNLLVMGPLNYIMMVLKSLRLQVLVQLLLEILLLQET